jgi:protein-export membrane protein SecD
MGRGLRWKFLILVFLVLGSIYLLYPSLKIYTMSPEEREALPEAEAKALRSKALKLGLDLQGGMHLVLELDRSRLKPEEVPDAMARAMEILRNRVDQFGVAEPVIQQQGEDRIVIELPGLVDKERAVQLIGQTALLEFKLVKTEADTRQILERLDRTLARILRPSLADSLDSLEIASFRPILDRAPLYPRLTFGGVLFPEEDAQELQKLFKEVGVDTLIPRHAQLLWGAEPQPIRPGQMGRILYVLNRRAEMTGATVKNAIMAVRLDPNAPNAPGVSLEFNREGARKFRRVTGANVGRQLAIVLDGKVRSAPVIRERIPSGRAQITGRFTDEEARDLAIVLRAGALPAPVRIIEERTVGPSLGRDSIRQGIRAGLVGAALVLLFMVFYYRGSGVLAVVALALNILFLMAVLAGLRGTLTLPGIAGIVLTIGMAVDANVLVFERIREELRTGRTVAKCVEQGYKRALTTILDANLTTLISAAVLFQFGTGPIRGFATTLGIGIMANIYTAVFVTRMFFEMIMSRRRLEKLSI